LQSAGTTAITVDTSQNVGIGTATPTATGGYDKAIDLVGGSSGAGLYIRGATNPSTVYASIQYDNGANRTNINAVGTSNFLRFVTVDTERMRITSGGNLQIGTTSESGRLAIASSSDAESRKVVNVYNSAATSTSRLENRLIRVSSNAANADCNIQLTDASTYNIFFGAVSGAAYVVSNTAGVSLSSGGTSWSAISDTRLKNITGTYTNALSDIEQIEAIKFTWKEDADNKPQVGVTAQSVQKVVPESVEITPLAGSIEDGFLSVRYTELIPLMIQSIKDLKAINDTQAETINALTARIVALESK
jgi:hypothetical protein